MVDRPALSRLLAMCLSALVCVAAPAMAQDRFIDTAGMSADGTLTYTEVVVETVDADPAAATQRFSSEAFESAGDEVIRPSVPPIAVAGPFNLVAPDRIEMIGTVDADSPAQFASLMAAHPGVRELVMVECPGSVDEEANHRLAREVRAAALTTRVPAGGSVRSGAVDLFLAGVRREAAPDAEFGVHAWRDEEGHGPQDYAANDPVNTEYIDYYRDMGLSADTARRFYALTNASDFDHVRYLNANDMAAMGLATIVS